jgi:ferredoxin
MSVDSVTPGKERRLEDIRKESEQKACPVQQALYYMEEFVKGPMCGRCFPCALGTAEAGLRLRRLANRAENAGREEIETLRRIGLQMIEGSFCKKGRETGKYIIEMLSVSGDDFLCHVSGACLQKECAGFVEYSVNPELCDMCGKCKDVCSYNAITGEKRKPYLNGYLPFEIRQKRCTKCGECAKVCPTGAIESHSAAAEELVNG